MAEGPRDGAAQIPAPGERIERADAEWRRLLSAEQYAVLRQEGTERAFSGEYWDCHKPGVYYCAGCNAPLFAAEAKFDSGTGWPSFHSPTDPRRIERRLDRSWLRTRVEVRCASCGGHLGHVFEDGPPPTGLRYCINSASLRHGSDS